MNVGATLRGRPKEGTAQSPSPTERQSLRFAATATHVEMFEVLLQGRFSKTEPVEDWKVIE